MPDIMLSDAQVGYLRRHIHARFKGVMSDLSSFGASSPERETFELLNAFGGPIRGALPAGANQTTMDAMTLPPEAPIPLPAPAGAAAEVQQDFSDPNASPTPTAAADLSGDGSGPAPEGGDGTEGNDTNTNSLDNLGD